MLRYLLLLILTIPSVGLSETKKEEKKKVIEPVQQGAKSTPSTIPVEPVAEDAQLKNEKKVDEADTLITNRRLRADSGSLSKWSGSMFFNYQGGSLANPTKPERPNIVNGADALTLQNLIGEVGIRYRFGVKDSLTASTGLFMTTPFHSSIDTKNKQLEENFNENKQELNVSDPFLRYTHIDKIFDLQSVTNFKPLLITNNQQKEAGYRSSWNLAQTFMKDFGKSGFSIGGLLQTTWYTFHKDNDALARHVSGFYPAAEYVINDTFNLRTIFGWQVYEQSRGMESDTWVKRKVYQSVGLGISLSRDVFLYPNVQYIPSDVRLDRTNIAISTNINVF